MNERVIVDSEQRNRIEELCRGQDVCVLTTLGVDSLTAHLRAFVETEDFDLVLIMLEGSEKYSNLLHRPGAAVVVDDRDISDVPSMQVERATFYGLAQEIVPRTGEWERLKGLFLSKNPFEEPFFGYEALRMIRLKTQKVSYAKGLQDTFKVELA